MSGLNRAYKRRPSMVAMNGSPVLCLDAGSKLSYPGSGTTWTDLSGNGYNGTLVNSPTFDSGNGGSIVLNGTNQYASITTNTAFDLITNHTISVWFYMTSSPSVWAALVGKGTNDADEQYCLVINAARTQLYYDIGNGSGPFIQPTLTSTISLNAWYNIVVTQSRSGSTSTLKSYLNGVAQTNATAGSGVTPNTNTSNFTIGVCRGTSFPFTGRISGVQLYNRTLSAAEIATNFELLRGRYGV